jgi:hypothetical protein
MRRILNGSANVILTFESEPQAIYNTNLTYILPTGDSQSEKEYFEVDVVRQLLHGLRDIGESRDMSRLVKISVCYDFPFENGVKLSDEETDKELAYLLRNNAKYYFQPNQRDDYEELIAEALGVASNTQNYS